MKSELNVHFISSNLAGYTANGRACMYSSMHSYTKVVLACHKKKLGQDSVVFFLTNPLKASFGLLKVNLFGILLLLLATIIDWCGDYDDSVDNEGKPSRGLWLL